MRLTTKRLLLTVGSLLGVLLLAAVVGGLWVKHQTSPENWPRKEFSSAAWKAAAPETRYVFYRDLADSGRIESATREELVNVLGEPSWEDPGGTYMTYVIKHREPGEWSFNTIHLLDIRLNPGTGEGHRYFIRGD